VCAYHCAQLHVVPNTAVIEQFWYDYFPPNLQITIIALMLCTGGRGTEQNNSSSTAGMANRDVTRVEKVQHPTSAGFPSRVCVYWLPSNTKYTCPITFAYFCEFCISWFPLILCHVLPRNAMLVRQVSTVLWPCPSVRPSQVAVVSKRPAKCRLSSCRECRTVAYGVRTSLNVSVWNSYLSDQFSVDVELRQAMSRATSYQQLGLVERQGHWVDVIDVLASPGIRCADWPHGLDIGDVQTARYRAHLYRVTQVNSEHHT